MHPDDVLDECPRRVDGWAKLYQNLTAYADWLYTSAPEHSQYDGRRSFLRHAEVRCAVGGIMLRKRRCTCRLGGFWDEAWLMVRFSKGAPGEVTGGTIERVDGDYYLLNATADQFVIR